MLVSVFFLLWHKNETRRLMDLRSFCNAADAVCLSFVSQSTNRLGSVGKAPSPPPPLLKLQPVLT